MHDLAIAVLHDLERRPPPAVRAGSSGIRSWIPAADVVETAESYFVALDAPGLPRSAFDLRVEQQALHIRGNRPPEAPHERPLHRERGTGAFERVFLFPKAIDPAGIVAHYEHGVLRVMVPKAAESKARRIRIT
ncbi:Hsp20/alpha crystallin family protein [Rhodocaloribacter litoris]|uniref:Hsp20/alpha crystallin family protein n=1 Tax=Rhodocaloribacter litoris TaxID=2558931 RepID=UPI0014235814|nr:Hsp20/alpha crystallin family protein [Rhodocaloribacter litoris]QXD13959.1 Hsp20/alpha crystallin family protein [Rhodocaloribacter litoris]